MIDTVLLVVILVGVSLVAAFVFRFLKKLDGRKDDGQGLLLIQNQINELNRTIDSKLGESTKVIQEQFGQSAKIIREITQELTKVSEGHKQVMSITDQLKNLQDILKNPKQRGIMGEYLLETVLKNVLPPGAYQMQYSFRDGVIVDAVIFYQEKIIPIDSKFSLENYNRLVNAKDEEERKRFEDSLRADLKNRIDETSKYIKPADKTFEFAFMFIPSEGLYYDLLVNKVGAVTARDLISYAAEKKVFIVSPTSFLAYLQTVIQGLRQMEFSKSAEQIQKNVGELGRHIKTYETYMKKLGNNLGTSVNMYNSAYKELGKIDKDVLKITGKAIGIEPSIVQGPSEDAEHEEQKTLSF